MTDELENLLARATTISYQPPVMLWADYVGAVRQFTSFKELREAIQSLIDQECTKARLRGVEEVLLKLKQAPPIDWIDAQSWIDGEYARLQAQLKEENDCTCICHSPAYYAPHKTGHACCDEANVIEDNSLLVKTTNIIPPPDKEK